MMDKNICYLIVVVIILYFIYKIWNKKNNNTEQENYENNENNENQHDEYVSTENDVNNTIDKLINEEGKPSEELEDSSKDINWLDKAKDGKYVHSSYVGGVRGNTKRSLESQDSYNTELAANLNFDNYAVNNDYIGFDEAAKYKPYTSTQKRKLTTKETYDSSKLLPNGEVNKDWFEVAPDPIKVKNRHLINISQPIGIDTVGSSKRNMSRDLRGDILNPKRVVSPWMNSSIQPDYPTVGLC